MDKKSSRGLREARFFELSPVMQACMYVLAQELNVSMQYACKRDEIVSTIIIIVVGMHAGMSTHYAHSCTHA